METFNNSHIDSTATLIEFDLDTAEIRRTLLSKGLTEYDAFLCWKAAIYLLAVGFYDIK